MFLGRSFRRRLVVVSGVLVATAVLTLALVHAPFVRSAALRYAVRTVQEQYEVRLEASRLDYNLAALRLGLADLRVSALHTADQPFLTADYLSVTLPWRIVFGDVAFDDISATNARVFVRRQEDGTSNLPTASGAPGGEPPALRVQRLNIPQLAVDLRDEQAAAFLWLPSVALLLTPDMGHLKLGGQGQLNTEAQITHISEMSGSTSFDGRALHLRDLQVQADEGAARLDGSITLIARDAAVDLSIRGNIDATRAARWVVTNGDLPRGNVTFEAQASGTFDDVGTRLSISSERLSWQNLTATDLAARARITSASAEVEELGFGFVGGRATATASVPFDPEAAGRVSAAWKGIDAAEAAKAMTSGANVLPAAIVSGDLNAEGTGIDVARWSGKARLMIAPGRNARGRVALAGDLSLGIADGKWRLDGRYRVGGVVPLTLTLNGNLDNAVDGTIHVGQTDMPALVDMLNSAGLSNIPRDAIKSGMFDGDVHVGGELADLMVDGQAVVDDVASAQAHASVVQVDFSGRPVASQLQFRVEAPAPVVADQQLQDVAAAGRLIGTQLVIDEVSASQPSTSGLLTANGTYDLRSGRYTANLQGAQWRLDRPADQPVAGTVDVRFAGEGTLDDPRGTGQVTVREAMWGDSPLGSLDASVELDGGAARIDARAPEFATNATGRVQLQAPYDTSVDVSTQELDLSQVLKFVDTPATVSGTTSLTLHAELPLQTWRSGSVTLDVVSLDALAGDLPVKLDGRSRIRYDAERVHVDRLDLTAGDVAVSASGSLPVFEPAPDSPALLLTATGNVDEVVRAATALGLTQLPVTGGDGPVALLSRLTGTIQQPVVSADLEMGPASIALEDSPAVSRLIVRAHAENGWFELREGAAEYEGSQLSATGRAPLSMFNERLAVVSGSGPTAAGADLAEVHARATNLTPAVLAPFVELGTLDELSGSIDASLEASTPTLELADLTGELRIDRFDLRVAELPVTQRLPTRIVARDGFARVEAWEWIGQGTTFTVRGQVNLENRQAAILANGAVDLRLLTPFVRTAGLTTGGRLEPRLSITGALDDPRVDGDLVVTDGELRLAAPRVVASDVTLRTVLTRTTARITQFNGSVNGGTVTGGGTMEYTPDRGLQAELSTEVRGMALEYPTGLRTELDADVNLAFAAAPGSSTDAGAGKLSGTVTVLEGAYREPMAVVTGLLASMRAQQLTANAAPSPFLEALALDIRVITDEDVLVDNNYGRLQLGADLRLIGTAQTPGLSGRAELREGGQLFVGRNVYTVNFGAIDFSNPVAIEPNLNVEATTRAGGEDIEVTITGPAESPKVDLRSTSSPELGQAEVASLLLTGRPLENLAPDDAAFIGTQVLGNFSGEVLGFASRAVGLDTIRLGGVENQTLRRDPTEVATTKEDPTTRVTFGKSLAPNVDLTFSQSLRDGDAQTWIIDYLPRRELDLRLVSDDDDLRSYGFRHEIALGPKAPTIQPRAPGRPRVRVSTVSVTGELALPEMRVRETLRLREGDTFDFAEWQSDRDRLENLYRREGYLTPRISARRTEQDGGVTLAYEVAAGPKTVIVVRGIELDSTLRSRLETAWFESVYDEFLIEEAVQTVREDLGRRGYLQPTIKANIGDEGGVKTLEIVVEPGPRSTRTTVRIDGVPDALAEEITTRLRERALLDQAISNQAAVASEVESYLRSRGYVRAQVTVAAPLFMEETATLPVRVDPGPVFRIASIAFEGAQALPENTLREAVALDAETPYDPETIEAARTRLVALYRGEGFAGARVTVRSNIDPAQPFVALTLVVDAGPRQVLSEIAVTGNRAIDSDVILRALNLPLDAPLRAEEMLQARTRVFETGLFRRIDVAAEPRESTGGEVVPMRVRVTVEEWPIVRFRYGFVVAEERPEDDLDGRELVPGVSGDVVRRTLFGRAISIGTALELQRREQSGRLFGSAPTFLGLPIRSSLVGERSRQVFQSTSFVTNRTSVTWEQQATITRTLSLSYSYAFGRDHTFDTKTTEEGGLVFDIAVNRARLNTAAAWDSRDDPADATQGLFASSSFDYAPEALGSDFRFVGDLTQAYYFRSWRSVVFASAARLGVVVPIGDRDLIPSDRLFAGGSRTVRGVAENGLGPRNIFGEPAGGQLMIVLNQEMRVPIYGWVRGVTFIDVGNVFARPRDTSFRDLIGSIGVGLRVVTPFALLRVDYGRAMWGLSEPTSGRWTFGIGQIF